MFKENKVMVIIVIVIYSIILFVEVPSLFQQEKKKELILYFTLITFSFILNLLLSLDIKIPSPAEPIKKIVFMILGKSS